MKVTVIGSGNMGAAFVKQLQAAGHAVRVTGRDAMGLTVGHTTSAAEEIAKASPRSNS